jgi:N6-L-threonylcarbamoyladenine synthase
MVAALVSDVCTDAEVDLRDIDVIAATAGPGLAGALIVGLSYGKALAYALGKPFAAVNHIEAHMYAACAEADIPYPFLSLVVSGGHTLLADITGDTEYSVIGRTRDDAAGEAFDKGAKILGLGFPGGLAVQQQAQTGNPAAYRFPRAMLSDGSHDFSFSGVKTALLYFCNENPEAPLADVAASYQEAIVDVLVKKTIKAALERNRQTIVIGGGVSANARLRAHMTESAEKNGIRVVLPSFPLCTDNARMIAYRGYTVYQQRGSDTLETDIFTSFNPVKELHLYETQ